MPNYHFDLSKVYFIWFSHYPDEALGVENELRLIRMREKSPQTIISLVYSSQLLTTNAVTSLRAFCGKHRIVLYDFDTEVMSLLTHPKDIRMFQITRKELMMTKKQLGGNFAAASDSLRLVVPVIAKLGIYVDLDVPCAFGNSAEIKVSAEAPLLLNVEGELVLQGRAFNMYVNTDFIACAYDENNPTELAKDALTTIRCIQDRIIKNYDDKLTMDKLFNPMELAADAAQDFNYLFSEFIKTDYPQSPYGLRRFILEYKYPGASNELRDILKENFLKTACSRISGPSNFWSLYMYAKPPGDTFTFGSVPALGVYADYIKLFIASNATKHPVISKCVTFTNTRHCEMEYVKKHGKNPEAGVLADLSWTARGKDNKDKREATLLAATINVQRLFRQHHESRKEAQPVDDRPSNFIK